MANAQNDAAESSMALYINPSVSVMLTKTPLPLEFKLQYYLPVWGMNTEIQHTFVFQVRAYFALPGADI